MNIVFNNNLDWFQCGPLPAHTLSGFYNYTTVGLSFLIAIIGSYVALDLVGSLREEKNDTYKIYWLLGGAFVMGSSIWAMHFVGMLAFMLPIVFTYDPLWTFSSLLAAIIASGIAFYTLRLEQPTKLSIIIGGTFVGLGIVVMHYVGMEALEGTAVLDIRYVPGLFFLSIAIAIAAAMVALFLANKSDQVSSTLRFRFKIVSAIIMAVAICGMHYTGMASAIFIAPQIPADSGITMGRDKLASYISVIIVFIVFITLVISAKRQLMLNEMYRKNEEKCRRDIETSYHLLEQRLTAVTQLAAGVAHEINNPLSYILSNISVLQKRLSIILQLQELYQALLGEIKNSQSSQFHNAAENVALFCAEKKIPMIIEDSNNLITESKDGLLRIKDIISNLRNFSSPDKKLIETVNINMIIESSLEIFANKFKEKCVVHKKLSDLPPIIASSKQLTILFTNLLSNAEESIVDKGEITISSFVTESHIVVKIKDNGCGISPENISKVFNPFFTTKPIGKNPGLGLSTVYGIAQLYGGSITIESDLGKGSTFTLSLPINANS